MNAPSVMDIPKIDSVKPIRIAHIYDSKCGRNDGAPLYTLQALKKTEGVRVYHYLPKGSHDLWGKYDLYWWVDFADDALGYQNFPMPSPSFYWCSDYHISQESFDYRLKRAKEATWVGCYQKRNVEEFIQAGIDEKKIFWLPPAVEPSCYRPGLFDFKTYEWRDAVRAKKYDVCFVGHVNNQKREEALDQLFKGVPNFFYGNRVFEACANKYQESKVVFNISHRDDINMRVFEVMGTKSFLLTEDIPTLHELFTDGVHLVTYKTIEEAIDKANYYAAHDEEREKIAEAGYQEVISKHTYRHRIDEVLRKIRGGEHD